MSSGTRLSIGSLCSCSRPDLDWVRKLAYLTAGRSALVDFFGFYDQTRNDYRQKYAFSPGVVPEMSKGELGTARGSNSCKDRTSQLHQDLRTSADMSSFLFNTSLVFQFFSELDMRTFQRAISFVTP
jgi:hypothetical protein